jgi:ATP-dependent DNA helicase RecG
MRVRFTVYLAEPMILTREKGPGRDQIGTKSGLSQDQVRILQRCSDACGITDLMAVTGRSNRTKFRNQVLKPLLSSELIEMTVPDKPSSSKQKYRLTEKEQAALKNCQKT